MYISNDEKELLSQAISALQKLYARIDESVEEEKQIARARNNILQTSPLDNSDGLDFLKEDDKNISSIALEFTEEDFRKMPTRFKSVFQYGKHTARVYIRYSGSYATNYEIRYRRNGYRIYASSNNLAEAKKKFIQQLRMAKPEPKKPRQPSIPKGFTSFALYYFENFRKRKVKPTTYANNLSRFNLYLKPYFAEKNIKTITPAECQKLIDDVAASGKERTSEDLFMLMSSIFKNAIAHNLIDRSPLDIVILDKHDRNHGKALTKTEEKKLLKAYAFTKYGLMFAVALYTGMRPGEYHTARIEGEFIICENSKRHSGKVEYKKIPITPMLRPYLEGVTELEFVTVKYLRERLSLVLPDYILYDLRTTFYTRCQECGIAPAARDEFVGHSLGVLGNTYTDLSDEFLLKEAQKFKY